MRRIFLIGLIIISLAGLARADLPDQLSGSGLTVRFTDKSATPAGTLEMEGQSYPFRASFSDKTLTGRFQANGEWYEFTLVQNGDDFVLETGGARYTLNPPKRNPLARGDAKPPVAGNQPVPAAGGAKPSVNVIYEPQNLVDPTTKLEVATLLVPQGWKLEPGILWRPMAAQFVTLETSIVDPNRGWAVRWIPHDQFSCDPTLFNNARQQGVAPVSGGMELTDSVLNAQQYVQAVVLPRYRQQQGVRIIGAEDQPKLVELIGQTNANIRALYQQNGRELQYSAARVRIEYPGPGGTPLEEDIYCVMQCSWDVRAVEMARQVGLSGSYWFAPERLYGLAAPKGQLDAAAPYLQTIVSSMRPTARWIAFVDNIQGMIGKIQLDTHAMEVAARKEITESQRRSVEESWKSADQQSREVGALLSGTQARTNPNNPNGPPIAGPAGKHSWVNPQGQWQHLEPGDDPNTHPGSSKDWRQASNTQN